MEKRSVVIKTIDVDGLTMFYREAGLRDAPVVLLLHGFPASSFQYRELIPRLADRYRVIAPDFPGFGFTNVPAERHYAYTFDALANTTLAFTEALNLKRYALYLFDYGAPVGFRLAAAHPERVRGRSSRKTATPTRKGWAMHGHRSNGIGKNPRRPTVRPYAPRSPGMQFACNTPMAFRSRNASRRRATRSMRLSSRGPATPTSSCICSQTTPTT